jgi:uncharacterized protein RhaS with RHS repeats
MRMRNLIEQARPGLGNVVSGMQMGWREQYTYDGNGNRASKVTPWGTIRYEYDAEIRLVKKGDVVYDYDKDGNLVSEQGARRAGPYGSVHGDGPGDEPVCV